MKTRIMALVVILVGMALLGCGGSSTPSTQACGGGWGTQMTQQQCEQNYAVTNPQVTAVNNVAGPSAAVQAGSGINPQQATQVANNPVPTGTGLVPQGVPAVKEQANSVSTQMAALTGGENQPVASAATPEYSSGLLTIPGYEPITPGYNRAPSSAAISLSASAETNPQAQVVSGSALGGDAVR